jgi:hypothetical protein
MIRFNIQCKCTAKFEGQFPDVKQFDAQKKRGLIICPMCDGTTLTYSKISKKPKKITKH